MEDSIRNLRMEIRNDIEEYNLFRQTPYIRADLFNFYREYLLERIMKNIDELQKIMEEEEENEWNNFNDAEDQMSYELIPHKTIAKVRLMLKKGNHITDEFPDGYATLSKAGTSIYLVCEFVILNGEYENRKVWSKIGLHSINSEKYSKIGRSMIKAILDSAHSLHSKDKSPEAEKQRQIKSFADLDNLVCLAEITINDKGDSPRNEIKTILTPDHAKYSEYMDEKSGKFPINYGVAGRHQQSSELTCDEIPF